MQSEIFLPQTSLQYENQCSHCRFCAEESRIDDLLDLSGDRKVLKECLRMIEFLKIDFINLSDAILPKTSCQSCYNALKGAFDFVEKAKQSQLMLNNLYNMDIKQELIDATLIKKELDEDSDDYVLSSLVTVEISELPEQFNGKQPSRTSNNVIPTPSEPTKQSRKSSRNKRKNKRYTQSSQNDSEGSENESGALMYSGMPVFQSTIDTKALRTRKPKTINEYTYSAKKGIVPVKLEVTKPARKHPILKDGRDVSWTSYSWSCIQCKDKFQSMSDVREHSKAMHGTCYGFNCMDCDERFNTFNSFVEHARHHREFLRYYCQYCNLRFNDSVDCQSHVFLHWAGKQKICDLCGEIHPDAEALDLHKRIYRQFTLPRSYYRKRAKLVVPRCMYNGIPVYSENEFRSWKDYEWTCRECYTRTSDAEQLREHARSFHDKCFTMKCVDCLKVLRNYVMFTQHVVAHRPYLKHYCPYCDAHFPDLFEITVHIENHKNGPQKPCDGCGQIFENNTLLFQHLQQYDPPRQKGSITSRDLTCEICGRVYKSMALLRAHRRTHNENRKRDHVCETCGRGFYTLTMLTSHMLIHTSVKNEVCRLCNKVFFTKQKLRAHVATHMEDKLFNCDQCGKSFRTRDRLSSHLISHSDIKKFQCVICEKQFKFKPNLTTHMNIHTGLRPYSCEYCEKTFTNWANCNKHMIRKHGVSLARTKLTPQGRVDINRQTGKARKLATDSSTKEWINEVMTPLKRGKGKKTIDKETTDEISFTTEMGGGNFELQNVSESQLMEPVID